MAKTLTAPSLTRALARGIGTVWGILDQWGDSGSVGDVGSVRDVGSVGDIGPVGDVGSVGDIGSVGCPAAPSVRQAGCGSLRVGFCCSAGLVCAASCAG